MNKVKITRDHEIAYINPNELQPFKPNARKHSRKQLKQIAASIDEFGFANPVLIDQNNTILAGHGRVEAAKLLNMDIVPCVYIEHLTDSQKRTYVLADNQLALNAPWDEDMLADELKALSNVDLGFELAVTGFSVAELDLRIGEVAPEEAHDPRDDQIPSQIEKCVQ